VDAYRAEIAPLDAEIDETYLARSLTEFAQRSARLASNQPDRESPVR
jgi:hypothetical protein